MAAYTVPAGHIGVYKKNLAANTVDTVTFVGVDLTEVEVISAGAGDIYVSFGADTIPTVEGTDCYLMPGASVSAVFTVRTSGDTVVKLISESAQVYSVART